MSSGPHNVKWHVRWRHIPPHLAFTPLMYISIEHTEVWGKPDSTHYDLQVTIAAHFENLKIDPDHVRIETAQSE